MDKQKQLRYLSLFSGIGGFELGISRAMDNRGNSSTSTLEERRSKSDTDISNGNGGWSNATCVGYSEIDKYAIKVYERHFGNGKSNNEYAHISEESKQEERTQGRKRSTDKQSVLLHDRNGSTPLCNTNGGHTNYGDATTINAKELPDFDLLVGGFPCQAFSVAGKRKGFDDTRGTLFFDIARILAEKRPRHLLLENVKGLLSHDKGKTFQTILGVLSDLGYRVEWQVLNSKDFGVPQNRERIFIIGHLRGECGRKVLPITYSYRKSITKNELHDRQQLLERDKPSSVQEKETQTDSYRIRRLTPKECERLQGFPDDWTEWGVEDKREYGHIVMKDRVEISDTQRYKMCGNAVTVNVIEAIMREFKCL